MLRVHHLGFARREAEEGGVEVRDSRENRPGADVGGVGQQRRVDSRSQ